MPEYLSATPALNASLFLPLMHHLWEGPPDNIDPLSEALRLGLPCNFAHCIVVQKTKNKIKNALLKTEKCRPPTPNTNGNSITISTTHITEFTVAKFN